MKNATRERRKLLDRITPGEPTLQESLHRLSQWPDNGTAPGSDNILMRIGAINRQFALSKGSRSRGGRR